MTNSTTQLTLVLSDLPWALPVDYLTNNTVGIPYSCPDLEALENYAGTPFLPSDSDLLLDSPDHDDIGKICLCL